MSRRRIALCALGVAAAVAQLSLLPVAAGIDMLRKRHSITDEALDAIAVMTNEAIDRAIAQGDHS